MIATKRAVCTASHRDRFGTIHECNLDSSHWGYHRTVDGLMFHDEDQVRLRRVPIRAEKYLGKTAIIRELAEVIEKPELSGVEWAPVTVKLNGQGVVTLYPGEWLVQYDDGWVEHWASDRFDIRFEVRDA